MPTTIQEEDQTETETEKDHTTLLPYIEGYHKSLFIAVKTYQDDLDELTKIQARVNADAINLSALRTKIDTMLTHIKSTNASRTDFEKFSTDCTSVLEKTKAEIKS